MSVDHILEPAIAWDVFNRRLPARWSVGTVAEYRQPKDGDASVWLMGPIVQEERLGRARVILFVRNGRVCSFRWYGFSPDVRHVRDMLADAFGVKVAAVSVEMAS